MHSYIVQEEAKAILVSLQEAQAQPTDDDLADDSEAMDRENKPARIAQGAGQKRGRRSALEDSDDDYDDDDEKEEEEEEEEEEGVGVKLFVVVGEHAWSGGVQFLVVLHGFMVVIAILLTAAIPACQLSPPSLPS
jgi:ribosomal protein L12E/L44/L45/RPP1/RPP2